MTRRVLQIQHDGQITNSRQATDSKIFCFTEIQIGGITAAVSRPRRDVSRSSRYVGHEMRWTLWRQVFFTGRKRPQRTAKSCGPDAATLASSRPGVSRRRRWQKRPLTGESTYKP